MFARLKKSTLVDIGAGTKAVLASAQVSTKKKEIVSIQMQTNYHQNPH